MKERTSCITHATTFPYGTLQLDYVNLYDKLAQVAIMQQLETAPQDEWTPLTFEDIAPRVRILDSDRWDFNSALTELVKMGHITKHPQGEVYRLNIPVVQKALDDQVASLNA